MRNVMHGDQTMIRPTRTRKQPTRYESSFDRRARPKKQHTDASSPSNTNDNERDVICQSHMCDNLAVFDYTADGNGILCCGCWDYDPKMTIIRKHPAFADCHGE